MPLKAGWVYLKLLTLLMAKKTMSSTWSAVFEKKNKRWQMKKGGEKNGKLNCKRYKQAERERKC